MSHSLLILRPQPGADMTAAKARALSFNPTILPLFTIAACDWSPPDPATFDALMLTSANAVRHAGPNLARYSGLPTYAVGEATAWSARAAGLTLAYTGRNDATHLVAIMANAGVRTALHLTGREHHGVTHPRVAITHRIVYAADAIDPPPNIPAVDLILTHSARAARRLADIVQLGDRQQRRVLALSAAIAAALGSGWAMVETSPAPNDDALLAHAAKLCKEL